MPVTSLSPVLGIDFGTTNSLIAIAKEGQVSIIPNERGASSIASTVLMHDDQLKAINRYEVYPHGKTLHSIKRLIGKDPTHLNTQKLPPLLQNVIAVYEEKVMIQAIQRHFTPIEIAAVIFSKLKEQAENYLQQTVQKVVVTVPAYFGEAERLAIKQAANLAGLQVLRLLAEPTAAALAYRLPIGGTYLVYDLGGGTFDLSLIRIEQDAIEVIAVGGDAMLGGDDLDNLLLQYLINKYSLSKQSNTLALEMAKQLKEALSFAAIAQLRVGDQEISLSITEFEQVVENTIEYTMKLARKLLYETGTIAIDGCVLVGGSSKINLITRKLVSNFHSAIFSHLDPELVVAMGAALQAENLQNNSKHLLIDVLPLSLGLEVMGGMVEKILLRNSPIPTATTKYFTTQVNNQTAIVLHVMQGEREMVKDLRSIAQFELKNLPPLPAGSVKVAVTFSVSQDGLLEVKASEEHLGLSQVIQVSPAANLTDLEIQKMIEEANNYAQEDLQQRKWQQTVNEAKMLVQNITIIQQELNLVNQDLKLEKQLEQVNTQLTVLVDTLNTALQDLATLQTHLLRLELLAKPIIEFYSNQKLAQLLQGKKIGEL